MILTNTHLSKDCTRKALVYVDRNGHYHVKVLGLIDGKMQTFVKGRSFYKHIESCNRAVARWLKTA